MEIQKLTASQFKPGERYSLIGLGNSYFGSKSVIDAKFVKCEENPRRSNSIPYNVFYFKAKHLHEEIKVELLGTSATTYEVIHHTKGKIIYILVGHDYLIGSFENQSGAQEYLEDNKQIFKHLLLGIANPDAYIQICDSDTIEVLTLKVMEDSDGKSTFHPKRATYQKGSLLTQLEQVPSY